MNLIRDGIGFIPACPANRDITFPFADGKVGYRMAALFCGKHVAGCLLLRRGHFSSCGNLRTFIIASRDDVSIAGRPDDQPHRRGKNIFRINFLYFVGTVRFDGSDLHLLTINENPVEVVETVAVARPGFIIVVFAQRSPPTPFAYINGSGFVVADEPFVAARFFGRAHWPGGFCDV